MTTPTGPPVHPSRFAEDPEWESPGAHAARCFALVPRIRGDAERRLLARAANRLYFSDCTPAEQALIRELDTRR